jgi:hypothetical protein
MGFIERTPLSGVYESRRYVRNSATKQFELVREPYDRNTLLLATTRASNVAADILEGLAEWRREPERARAKRTAHINNVMVFEGPEERPTTHALDLRLPVTVCGLDAAPMGRYRDLSFKNSNPGNQCQACRTTLGL